MSSKNFKTQEVIEISRKEAGESRGFPILYMGIIKDVFQMEGKKCNIQEDTNDIVNLINRSRPWITHENRYDNDTSFGWFINATGIDKIFRSDCIKFIPFSCVLLNIGPLPVKHYLGKMETDYSYYIVLKITYLTKVVKSNDCKTIQSEA